MAVCVPCLVRGSCLPQSTQQQSRHLSCTVTGTSRFISCVYTPWCVCVCLSVAAEAAVCAAVWCWCFWFVVVLALREHCQAAVLMCNALPACLSCLLCCVLSITAWRSRSPYPVWPFPDTVTMKFKYVYAIVVFCLLPNTATHQWLSLGCCCSRPACLLACLLACLPVCLLLDTHTHTQPSC